MKLGLKFGLLALGLAMGQAFSSHAGAQQPSAQTKPNTLAEPEPPDLSSIVDRVDRIAAALEAASVNENREAAEQRADQDLQAQKDMAQWAFWLLLTSALGLLVSVSGLIALVVSLRQTRTAIRDNREIGEAQARAYVVIQFKRATLSVNHPESRTHLIGQISNTGQSPARKIHVSVCGEIRVLKTRQRIGGQILGTADIAVLGQGDTDHSFRIDLPNPCLTAEQVAAIDDRVADFVLDITWTYTDVFKQTQWEGPRLFWGRPHRHEQISNAAIVTDLVFDAGRFYEAKTDQAA